MVNRKDLVIGEIYVGMFDSRRVIFLHTSHDFENDKRPFINAIDEYEDGFCLRNRSTYITFREANLLEREQLIQDMTIENNLIMENKEIIGYKLKIGEWEGEVNSNSIQFGCQTWDREWLNSIESSRIVSMEVVTENGKTQQVTSEQLEKVRAVLGTR